MELTRRGFITGAGAMVGAAIIQPPVVLAKELPRQKDVLEGHKYWQLVRAHVLGHLTIDEFAMGLPAPWQEYMSHWWPDGPKLHVPVYEHTAYPVSLTVALRSGYKISLETSDWMPFLEKWMSEVGTYLYGMKRKYIDLTTCNLGVAAITNIHLFRCMNSHSPGISAEHPLRHRQQADGVYWSPFEKEGTDCALIKH